MISVLFMLSWVVLSVLFSYLFTAFSLSWLSALLWLIAIVISFALSLAMMFMILGVWPLFQRGDQTKNMRNHHLAMSCMRLVLRILRVNLHVSGRENIPKTPFVLVGNHQSNYDIMGIKPFIKDQPMIFIAKKELFKWPVIGPYVRLLGNVPINRMTARSSIESIIAGIKKYKDGVPVAVFPEGTRSHSNTMIDFKPGALKLAMKPQAPILVVSVYNFCKIWQGWPFKTIHAYLHFHPIIQPESYASKNTQELSKEIKTMIQDKLDEFAQLRG